MTGERLQDYPALEKFMRLYWRPGATNFVDELLQFRKDALNTASTASVFSQFLKEIEMANEAGLIRKKLPQTLQVEFWGRHRRRISLEDYEAGLRVLKEIPNS